MGSDAVSGGGTRLVIAMLLPLLLAGCGDGGKAATGKLMLTGSSTVAPLALEIAKRYEADHPGVRIDVQTGGSSRGIADARSGVADIGMVSRALKPDEADLVAHAIAHDGIAVIVHASNPVTGLSADQIRAIYRGQIATWQAVGGPKRPITVVNKAEGRSTLELFLQHFGLASTQIHASVVIGDNEQGIKTVAGNPGAIGYVSVGAAEYAATHEVAIRLLPLDGILASTETVKDGRFPLSRPLNLVTRGQPQGLAGGFIAYARSAAVHDQVRSLYFVPLD